MAEGIVVSIHPASGVTGPMREVAEAAVPPAAEHGLRLDPGEARRNVVTRGLDLNGIAGEEFCVGEVLLRGARTAEPCVHLAWLVGEEVLPALVHGGGLREKIVRGAP